jgi:pilus assembly protein TadC
MNTYKASLIFSVSEIPKIYKLGIVARLANFLIGKVSRKSFFYPDVFKLKRKYSYQFNSKNLDFLYEDEEKDFKLIEISRYSIKNTPILFIVDAKEKSYYFEIELDF